MSIANYSVIGRILAEVQDASEPTELQSCERVETGDELLEVRRSRCVHTAPFATPLHFWAHALRALLSDRGRLDLFEAIATQALCTETAGPEVQRAFAALTARMELGAPSPKLSAGHRMVDQDALLSWVAEGDGEFVAFSWVRTDWLRDARPFDPLAGSEDESGDGGQDEAGREDRG